jgi:hypothetical protein
MLAASTSAIITIQAGPQALNQRGPLPMPAREGSRTVGEEDRRWTAAGTQGSSSMLDRSRHDRERSPAARSRKERAGPGTPRLAPSTAAY